MSTEQVYDFEESAVDEPEGMATNIINEARKWVGIREVPSGSDRTPIGEWAEKYGGHNGVAWCGNSVSLWIYVGSGGKVILCKGWKDAGVFSAGCDHVPSIYRWAAHEGILVDKNDIPEPGFLVLADEMNKGHATHIGLVESVDKTRVTTIEGNYSSKCCRLRRSLKDAKITGYIDLSLLFV